MQGLVSTLNRNQIFICPSFNVQSKHDDDSDNNDSDDDDFDDRIEYLMSLS